MKKSIVWVRARPWPTLRVSCREAYTNRPVLDQTPTEVIVIDHLESLLKTEGILPCVMYSLGAVKRAPSFCAL